MYPAREEIRPSRFTIDQLRSIIFEFKSNSEGGKIKSEKFMDIMLTRIENSKRFNDENGMPEVWSTLG